MKKRALLLSFIALVSMPLMAGSHEFCEGFKRGYTVGYKQAKGSSIDPIVPICPIQPIKGFGDPDSDYEHGYTVGFKKGLVDGSR